MKFPIPYFSLYKLYELYNFCIYCFLNLQQFRQPFFIKSDDQLAFNINHWHAHLA